MNRYKKIRFLNPLFWIAIIVHLAMVLILLILIEIKALMEVALIAISTGSASMVDECHESNKRIINSLKNETL